MKQNSAREFQTDWYKFLYYEAPVGLARTSLKTGEFIDCNDRLLEIFGYSEKEEFINIVSAPELYVDPEDRFHIIENLERDGTLTGVDVKLKRRNGQEFWGRFSAKLLPEANQLQVVLMDVTREQEILEMLRQSEKKYRALFEHLGDAVFIHDMQGNFLEVNSVACERLGYTREELLNLSPMDIDHEDYASKVPERISELQEKGHVFYETKHVTKDGKVIPTELSSRVIDYMGEPVVVTIARDISARLDVQEKMKEQKNFLEKVINSLDHPFYVIDVDTYEILMANEATWRQYGSGAMTCHELTHDTMMPCADDDHSCPLNELRATGEHVTTEHSHIDTEGVERVFEIHAHPIFDDSGNLTQMIEYTLDVTDREKAAAIRMQQQREMELYASLVKHDLSNDLQIVMGGIDIARSSIDKEDSQVAELLESVEATTKRMAHLLSVLGTPEEDAESDLLHILRRELQEASEIHDQFQYEMQSPKNKEEIEIRSSKLLPMVFENIFRNVAQHGGNNPRAHVDVTPKDEVVHVDITDNGPGIPEDLTKEIFKRKSSKKKGVGLYLSKEILHMIGGDISILRTQEDEGTTFRVTLMREN